MGTVQKRSPLSQLAYAARDRLNAPLFGVIHTDGACVLDVGGGAFHERLRARGHRWHSYAVVEPATTLLPAADPAILRIVGSAEQLPFADASFDVVLAIQVLEHVFDPQLATREMFRVLRRGGKLIILVPQSGTLHLVPHHYANLTRFWIFEQARRLGAEIVSWRPIGGAWRTIASRLALMFLPVFDLKGTQDPALCRRSVPFWVTLPLQILIAAIILPIALLLSLADIREEACNHLVVLRKPGTLA